MSSSSPYIKEVLITEAQIKARIKEVAKQIANDYRGKVSVQSPLILVCVLRGAFLFMADLCRALDDERVPSVCEFMCATSYQGGMGSVGEVRLLLDLRTPIRGQHVMLVEDIVDTGRTFDFITKLFATRQPASIKMIGLLDKQGTREVNISADYVCFKIPPKFVVGYGLDYSELLRGMRDVAVFDQPKFEKMRQTKMSKL